MWILKYWIFWIIVIIVVFQKFRLSFSTLHWPFSSKQDNQSIVQWKVVPLETKSTTLYDSGFSMIAMIPKFKLTVWSIYMLFDDNYLRQMCACFKRISTCKLCSTKISQAYSMFFLMKVRHLFDSVCFAKSTL
jgi:hypothetical protein